MDAFIRRQREKHEKEIKVLIFVYFLKAYHISGLWETHVDAILKDSHAQFTYCLNLQVEGFSLKFNHKEQYVRTHAKNFGRSSSFFI